MRKTKIICTLGPATDKDDVLEQLIIEGMDVARFNFSHNSCEEQKERMDKVKALRAKHHRPVACLLDTKGPEIRIKTFKNGSIHLERGQEFCLTTRDVEGTEEIVSVTYEDFIKDISVGSSILIDDGLIELKVLSIDGEDAHCQVINGGTISNRKGVNLPGVKISMPYLSDKDKADILFGIQEDVDFIAASFTRNAGDIRQIRKLLKENGGEDIRIIAKVENAEGIENIDEIIEVSDGKMIIHKVCAAGKIVITATQMLDSMIKNPRPTRAETTDVANAIFDGTSAIMLSGETAAGAYPVEALKTMSKIAMRAERAINYQKRFSALTLSENPGVTDAICHATCSTAYDLNAKAIITVTKSGFSARMISRYRPACDIIGCAIEDKVCRQLNLSWGVRPILLKEEWEVFVLFDRAISAAKKKGYLEDGDVTVITSGVPIGRSGTTNMMKVQVVD